MTTICVPFSKTKGPVKTTDPFLLINFDKKDYLVFAKTSFWKRGIATTSLFFTRLL